MVVIGPYHALIVDINDLKSATERSPCIGTREHYNEGETHFLDPPANVESLKRVVASSYALVCLGSRIWRGLACVKSSKKVAEPMALIDSHEII
jgi:hypothetical protein